MNEATVRGHVLDPLLREIGYSWDSDHTIVREESISYPFQQLGRKSKRDRPLTGRPDYILDCRGVCKWVLEAKAEGHCLGLNEADQSYSYAVHPEVKALYYCLSDGVRFVVYSTVSKTPDDPILELNLAEDYKGSVEILRTFFSRQSLERRVRAVLNVEPPPNASRLILGGQVEYQFADAHFITPARELGDRVPNLDQMKDLVIGKIYPVEKGLIEVVEGNITVSVTIGGRDVIDISHMQRFGLRDMELRAIGDIVSNNPEQPTHLQTMTTASVNKGDSLHSSLAYIPEVQQNMFYQTATDVWAHVAGHRVLGNFSQSSIVTIQGIGDVFITMGGVINLGIR